MIFLGNPLLSILAVSYVASLGYAISTQGYSSTVIDCSETEKFPYAIPGAQCIERRGLFEELWKGTFGEGIRAFADSVVAGVNNQIQQASGPIADIIQTVDIIVSAASRVQAEIELHHKEGVPGGTFSKDLETVFTAIAGVLQELFPPPDQATQHNEREGDVRVFLDKVGDIVVDFGVKHGANEPALRGTISDIKPHILTAVVLIGDLSEQHPLLRNMLISVLLSRVFQALLPAVRFSVLRGLGYGSAGPVKGSIAAWAQNFFFGAAVPEGSWFSLLQRAGMSLLRRDMEDYGDVENKILSELFSI